MKEKEYIRTKALGTVTAAINVLNDLVPASLPEIIKKGESSKVLSTLYLWQDRLFDIAMNETEE